MKNNREKERKNESPYRLSHLPTRCISYYDLLECVMPPRVKFLRRCIRWRRGREWFFKGERERERDAEKKREDRAVPSQRQWVINGIVLWISPRACEFAFPRQRCDLKQSRASACPLRKCVYMWVYMRVWGTAKRDTAKTSLACIIPIARTHALSSGSCVDLPISVQAQCAREITLGEFEIARLFIGRSNRHTNFKKRVLIPRYLREC